MNIRKFTFLCIQGISLIAGCSAYDSDVPIHNGTAPVCADNEQLFRLQLITGSYPEATLSWFAKPVSYRVFTESTGAVHAECSNCRNGPQPGADVQLCLPKDECHTLAVGRGTRRYISCYQGVEEMVVSWGGEVLKRSNGYLFDHVTFGEGCKKTCNADNELEFEFFMNKPRDDEQTDPLVWELTDLTTGGRLLGNQAKYNTSFLYYEKACVPRSSCLKFYIGYPSNTTSDFVDDSMHSIRLDGVVYTEKQLYLRLTDLASWSIKLNSTTFLGSCAVEDICDPTVEHLVEQTFTTETDVKCSSYLPTGTTGPTFEYSSAIKQNDILFTLEDVDEGGSDYITGYWLYDEGYEVGRSYASKACVPKDKCAHLLIKTDSPVKSYSLFQDGEELTKRVVYNNVYRYYEVTATRAGACAGSSGSTLSLTLGRLVAATLTVVLAFW